MLRSAGPRPTYSATVSAHEPTAEVPETFRTALASVRGVQPRPEILIEEAPAPQRLAPYSLALTADVVDDDRDIATGRFVVLHDPDGHETWDGTFRVVTFTRADVEADIASDPFAHEVGWSWLVDALQAQRCGFTMLGGTVTRVASQSFGELDDRPDEAHLEVRASWTPTDAAGRPGLAAHLQAWLDLLATGAGLAPLPPGVRAIPSQPRRR